MRIFWLSELFLSVPQMSWWLMELSSGQLIALDMEILGRLLTALRIEGQVSLSPSLWLRPRSEAITCSELGNKQSHMYRFLMPVSKFDWHMAVVLWYWEHAPLLPRVPNPTLGNAWRKLPWESLAADKWHFIYNIISAAILACRKECLLLGLFEVVNWKRVWMEHIPTCQAWTKKPIALQTKAHCLT